LRYLRRHRRRHRRDHRWWRDTFRHRWRRAGRRRPLSVHRGRVGIGRCRRWRCSRLLRQEAGELSRAGGARVRRAGLSYGSRRRSTSGHCVVARNRSTGKQSPSCLLSVDAMQNSRGGR
jgi:hypothetical protein